MKKIYENKNIKTILIIVGIALLVGTIVCGYQAYTANDNADYAISAQASAIESYGWGAANSSYYNSYSSAKSTARGFTIASIICGLGAAFCFVSLAVVVKKQRLLE